ncbi:MAG: ribosome biogenesis GTPase Der [Spirochaetaceae bacterium]|nr:MAG: ribosome biogenesis GTPase Der [Spirochaetaceae bacterium]
MKRFTIIFRNSWRKDLNIQSITRADSLPRVAVVGRPNVGKSTLCNRLTHSRRSITDPTPGVTRDPVESTWQLKDQRVLLVDTGGVTDSRDSLDMLITEKAMSEISRADLVLLMLDVADQTPEDQEIVEMLRPYFGKLIVVANKADNDARERDAWNLLALGFSELLPVSSEHNIGLDDLEDAVYQRLQQSSAFEGRSLKAEVLDADRAPMRIGILGQPNTGKSTLTNAILNEQRSIVSEVAGTTRDIVEGRFSFEGIDWTIIDTAGIRRKRRVSEAIEYFSVSRAIGVIADADVVFLMIDAQKGLTDQDKKIAGQIVKHGRGVILVLNKWDLMPVIDNQLEAVQDRVRFIFPILGFAPIVPLSALKGQGIEDLLQLALKIRRQLNVRIETGVLNRHLQAWMEETPPPTKKNRRWKIRYITQVSAAPVHFILFVNRVTGFPESYQRYIMNRIRSQFGLKDIPISVELKDSRRD